AAVHVLYPSVGARSGPAAACRRPEVAVSSLSEPAHDGCETGAAAGALSLRHLDGLARRAVAAKIERERSGRAGGACAGVGTRGGDDGLCARPLRAFAAANEDSVPAEARSLSDRYGRAGSDAQHRAAPGPLARAGLPLQSAAG